MTTDKKKRTTLNLRESLWLKVQMVAEVYEVSASHLVELMIEAGLKNLDENKTDVIKSKLVG